MKPARLAAGGLLAWLGWRLLGPEPEPTYPAPQEHPWRWPGRTVFVGDSEFFIREAGDPDARPLVLVHGWGDHTALLWHRMASDLSSGRRLLMVDLRNHGRSDRRRGSYEIRELADDVAGVMAAVGVGQADVLGYSMGGMVAQELAHRHPGSVRSLVVGGTSAGGLSLGVRALAGLLLLAGRALDRVSRVELSAARWWYLRRAGVVPPENLQWLWDEQMARDPDLYWQAGFAAIRFDSTSWVHRVTVPSMIFIPTHDQLVRPPFQYDLAARLPGATVVELDGARHEAPLTHADEIVKHVEEFLCQT